MATQPTNLPVPSESPRDLKFNAGKIDEFVTSLLNSYVDRFGKEHYTIEGLRWLAQQAIAQYGWIPLGTFQSGATLTLPNQILKDESGGDYYRWDGSFPKNVPSGSTPSSTGGTGIGAWVSVGDSSLRAMLASADGRKLIGKAPTIAALRTIEPTQDKQWIDVEKYWDDSLPAQGTYWHDASDVTSADNGGTIIVTAGGKRWKFKGDPTVETYGAYGDRVHDDWQAIMRAAAVEYKVDFGSPEYAIGGELQFILQAQVFNLGSAVLERFRTPAERAAGTNVNLFRQVLTYREHCEMIGGILRAHPTDAGFVFGIFSQPTVYISHLYCKGVNFDKSLRICVYANDILCIYDGCTFGIFGTAGAIHMHYKYNGQTLVGSNLTSNANTWKFCRFFNAKGVDFAIEIGDGFMNNFFVCDFEQNNVAIATINNKGAFLTNIDGSWGERNTGLSFLRLEMDTTGSLQGPMVQVYRNCWLKLSASNTCLTNSATQNMSVLYESCAGSDYAGKPLTKITGVADDSDQFQTVINCQFTGWTGSSKVPTKASMFGNLQTPLLGLRDSAGALRATLTASLSRANIRHANGVAFQSEDGAVTYAEVVTTADGTQIRARSKDGSTMWKLQPPASGTTPTAAQWTIS
ncbi:hypothetical protein [Enterobacter sp.]|uniref:tail fiber/spike domain-containing protein n=1 Tax=Enterobacter sp. TaxID=42895 RepID=UPI00296E40CE|nr:hypothetical protein [Enterobacter sp.]